MSKVIETDNFGGDYPNESFVFESRTLSPEAAERIADILNSEWCPTGHERRYWRVVDDDYVLQPGFEP